MKKLVLIAIALTSVNAFATRARMLSLGNSPHLVDTQTVYDKPYDMFGLASDYVTLESGVTSTIGGTNQNANAEGMIVRTMGDAKLGLSLGHESQNASAWVSTGLRSFASGLLKTNQQNPIEFSYGKKAGDMTWAGTFVYSNYVNKVTTGSPLEKENSMGVRLGASQGPWDGTLSLGLANTANILNGSKFTGTLGVGLNGGYKMDTMYFFGKVVSAGAKQEDNAGTQEMKVTTQTLTLGVVNSHKKDGNELFYSIALNQGDVAYNSTSASTQAKITSLTLPITIGFEVDAASWVTLRGSVSQSTLINNTKNELSASEFAPAANSTVVAVGAGLKFNKINLDGTLSGLTGPTATQVLDGNTLLAQVGASYWF